MRGGPQCPSCTRFSASLRNDEGAIVTSHTSHLATVTSTLPHDHSEECVHCGRDLIDPDDDGGDACQFCQSGDIVHNIIQTTPSTSWCCGRSLDSGKVCGALHTFFGPQHCEACTRFASDPLGTVWTAAAPQATSTKRDTHAPIVAFTFPPAPACFEMRLTREVVHVRLPMSMMCVCECVHT